MPYGDNYMVGMHGLWWLFWLIAIGVVLFFVLGRAGQRNERARETPEELLRRRLAGGQITPEEFEKRKALLDGKSSGAPASDKL